MCQTWGVFLLHLIGTMLGVEYQGLIHTPRDAEGGLALLIAGIYQEARVALLLRWPRDALSSDNVIILSACHSYQSSSSRRKVMTDSVISRARRVASRTPRTARL